MKMKYFVVAALLMCLSTFAVADDVDLSGKWNIVRQTPRGEQSSEMTIVQKGETLAVTMMMRENEVVGTGTIKDGKLEWSITMDTRRGEFTLKYSGEVVDLDNLAGTMQLPSRRSDSAPTWKAGRIK